MALDSSKLILQTISTNQQIQQQQQTRTTTTKKSNKQNNQASSIINQWEIPKLEAKESDIQSADEVNKCRSLFSVAPDPLSPRSMLIR